MDGCHTYHFPPTGNSWALAAVKKPVSDINFFFLNPLLKGHFPEQMHSVLAWNHTERARVHRKLTFLPPIMKWYMDDIEHFNDNTGGFPMAQQVIICLQCRRWEFDPWIGKIPWRRKWQPTPVILQGKSHGQRSLLGYSPWDRRVRHDWSDLAHTHT